MFIELASCGKTFDELFSTCAVLGFVFKWRTADVHQFHSFRPRLVHSGSVSWDNCGRVSPNELQLGSHTMPGQHSQPTLPTDFVRLMVYACLAVICHLHLWQNDWGLLHVTAVAQEWNGYLYKSQHEQLTLEQKILLLLLLEIKPSTFQSRVRCCTLGGGYPSEV